jgi:hypothetical protein
MDNDGVSPQGVIDDLADQLKKASIECAILRTAVKQLQAEIAVSTKSSLPPVVEGPQALEDDESNEG